MSITKFRGCFSVLGPPLVIVVGIVLIVGFLYRPGGGPANRLPDEATFGNPALAVSAQPVYENELLKIVSLVRQQKLSEKANQPKQLPELSPSEMFQVYAESLAGGIDQSAVYAVAKKEGVETAEKELPAWAEEQVQKRYAETRQQASFQKQMYVMMAQQQLDAAKKKNPNGPEVQAAIKKLGDAQKMTEEEIVRQVMGGRSLEQALAEAKSRVEEMSKDAIQLRAVMAAATRDKLQKKFEASVDTSDQALKSSYDKYTFQQIVFTGADAKTKAAQVAEKIKRGMDFKDAMMQFTMSKDAKGEPNTSNSTRTRFDMIGDKSIEPLLNMKSGQVSEPIDAGTSVSIFKLIEIKPDVPKDFDKQKAARAKSLREAVAVRQLRDAIELAKRPERLQWKDEGWKLVFDLSELQNGEQSRQLQGDANKLRRLQAWRAVYDKSKNVTTINPEITALARYLAINQLDVETPPGPEKQKLQNEILDVYAQVIDTIGTTQVRFQYAQMLIDKKKGDEALAQLLEIVRAASPPDERTASIILQVDSLLPQAANLAGKDSKVLAEIQQQLQQWHKEDADRKKQMEDQKKLDEENRKKNEAEMKKLREQEQKNNQTPSQPKPNLAPQPGKAKGG